MGKKILVGSWVVLLLLMAGRARAQAPAWELAMSANNNQYGMGDSQAYAAATDAEGNIFITGSFTGTVIFGTTRLVNTGARSSTDVFITKWDATTQDFTWATSGGGGEDDVGTAIAVRGKNVYITGHFNHMSGGVAYMAGQALSTAGAIDMFVAKYTDTSTGHTPAASGFANGWVTTGGGLDNDMGLGIAVSGNRVYVTGSFVQFFNCQIAGHILPSAGNVEMFVAQYIDTSTSPSSPSFANGWAVSGGGIEDDYGYGIAVQGTSIYVTGYYSGNYTATIAGQTLQGLGSDDVFVAKYLDTSTGNTPATSSVANGWAVSGGGATSDRAAAIAVSGTGVFVTGYSDGNAPFRIAGQTLLSAGSYDMFLAKFIDTSTGSTPATSSVANGWATSGGGTGADIGKAVAVVGTNVFVTGEFGIGTNIRFAGQQLVGTGDDDVFVAKYIDAITGTTPATSSFYNGWAISGGGSRGYNTGTSLVVHNQQIYVAGFIYPPAAFGNVSLGIGWGKQIDFLARLTDPALPAAATPATPTTFALYPNPAPIGQTAALTGLAPGTAVQILDAMGRVVATATADAAGRATWGPGLPPGLYLVRTGASARRWAVE